VQDVISYNMNGGKMICLDELSSDEWLVAGHCVQTAIAIRDSSSSQTTTIQPPTDRVHRCGHTADLFAVPVRQGAPVELV
jgi:hypothetical protein